MIAGRARRFVVAGGALLALALAALVIGAPTGASQPYEPTLEFLSISSSAPGANADITFRTSLPAGNHVLGGYILNTQWDVAGFSNQLRDKVAAVVTMAINLDPDGNCFDGDSGTPLPVVPVPLLYKDPNGGGGPHAIWSGIVTDYGDGDPNTSWPLTFNVEPAVLSPYSFQLPAVMTDGLRPPGHRLCSPQVFTVTFCGRANPTPTATSCGSGNDPVVLTNPTAAGCYTWRLDTDDESGQHSAVRLAGVSIGGTPCASPTPTPPAGDSDGDGVTDASDNCPRWWNPSQNMPPWQVPANDPDCDGFGSGVETSAGTSTFIQCGANAWAADINNDTFSDISDISALGGSFGRTVPPAPARHNIAPDPVDGFVDITDISKMGAFFGRTCAPCPADLDCDAVTDAADNCPSWPNFNQNLPPWQVPANDPDCDGFSTGVETSAGTAAQTHCGVNAWPADINNDGFSDVSDISALGASFGKSVPPAPARHNIAPDPVDGFVDVTDISKMGAFFGRPCT